MRLKMKLMERSVNKEVVSLEEDLGNALSCLEKGGVILYPTDTIWGIGCDATNSEAVERIYQIKQRDHSKSMLVLIDGIEALKEIIPQPSEKALDLVNNTNEPLTVIYKSPSKISDNLIANDGTIGIRITNENFSKQLCRRFGRPIVSTSANLSNMKFDGSYNDISEDIKKKVDYIVNYGRNISLAKQPSRIVKINERDEIEIIR